MAKEIINKLRSRELPEGPIEAGQTLGMDAESVLERYLTNRNAILRLLRVYLNYSASDVATKLGISAEELERIEESENLAPYRLVPKFAEIFNVELKALLTLLGLAKGGDRQDSDRYFDALPLAAQYSGPELTRQEKVDLEELFRIILEQVKGKKEVNDM